MKELTTSSRLLLNEPAAITSYLAGLNSKQREAVAYGIKPKKTKGIGQLLVIAGAGSEKTKTLTYRVAHLLFNGTDPNRLLPLTFTRRTASKLIEQLRPRCVCALLQLPLSWICYFRINSNGAVSRISRNNGSHWGHDHAR